MTSIGISPIRAGLTLAAGFALASIGPSVASAALKPDLLRCEHRTDPMEIDRTRPRLSWIVRADSRGARQTGYRVLVASSAELLAEGKGDLWDSGEVPSDATTSVRYDGAELGSVDRCYWKVRVWDEQGVASPWSAPAVWAMGLLSESDWTAEWIGYDAARARKASTAPLQDAKWIAVDEAPLDAMPAGHRMYVVRCDLPADDPVVEAEVLAAADNRFWLAVNGKMVVHGEPGWARIKPVSIADTLESGENDLRFNVQNDEAGPTGLLATIRVKLRSGKIIRLQSNSSWRGVAAPDHHWPAQPLSEDQLVACNEVGAYGDAPWGKASLEELYLPPVPLLRTEFAVEKPVVQATLFASALGICDAYLNGELVSTDRFTPGWSDYERRVYFRAYDVTQRVQQGENALGAALSDGWYSGYIGWGRNRDHYGESPRLRMQLHLRFADGTSRVIGTGPEWRATDGPTREGDFLMGERFDARVDPKGWSAPGFDAGAWGTVERGAAAQFAVEVHPGPPVIEIDEFRPTSITEPSPGVYVFDLGQYIAGVARLKVNGRPGQEVTLRFAERLNPDGSVYTTNLRGARTVDSFVCSGGEEEWTPRFTFHGFQYVEVTGLSAPPTRDLITGVALSSDTPRAGSFESSDPMLNRLASNIYWTQRANFIDVPTDCPQRDERLGWTGDAQQYVAAACLNADVQAFFDKWLVDLEDGQRADGQFPSVAPLKVAGDDGGPAWADAGVICPWVIYQTYGDKGLLRRQYPSMKRFVEFCKSRSRDGLLPPAEFHCFGDWLSVNADTPKEVIYTAYYAHSTRLLARAAAALGEASDAAEYNALADRIAAAFRDEFVDAEGVVRGDTQCGYVLALAHDLLDDDQRAVAADRLVADIESRGDHLSTGFVGTKELLLTLAKVDRNDVALRLIHQETYPSWGFSISHGATSIWERWDGWTPERGFQDPGMNSFAHYSFGAVYQWMVENLGGIQNGGDAYRRVTIRPALDDGLTHCRVTYDSVRGRIVSHWRREPDGVRLDVTIPANCEGLVYLPAKSADGVLEGSAAVEESRGVKGVTAESESLIATVESGQYSFFIPAE